jgi:hypothetical protein
MDPEKRAMEMLEEARKERLEVEKEIEQIEKETEQQQTAPAVTFRSYAEVLDAPPPPRQWIYPGYFIRRYVTILAAGGGTGKTSIVDVMAISVAIGRDLFENRKHLPGGPKAVVMLSLEDGFEDLHRRHYAIVRHYDLDAEERELLRKNIHISTIDEGGATIVAPREGSQTVEGRQETIDALLATLTSHEAGLLIVDPLVAFHGANENDTAAMQLFIDTVKRLAIEGGVSVALVHHVAKGATPESVDAVRGSTTVVNAARIVKMFYRPTEEACKELDIPEQDRPYVILETTGKDNLNRPEAVRGKPTRSYIMRPVPLGNGDDIYPQDSVGVAERYEIPDALERFTEEDIKRIRDALAKETIRAEEENDYSRLRASKKAETGWIGNLMLEAVNSNYSKDDIRKLISHWAHVGTVKKRDVPGWHLGTQTGRTSPVYILDVTEKERAFYATLGTVEQPRENDDETGDLF